MATKKSNATVTVVFTTKARQTGTEVEILRLEGVPEGKWGSRCKAHDVSWLKGGDRKSATATARKPLEWCTGCKKADNKTAAQKTAEQPVKAAALVTAKKAPAKKAAPAPRKTAAAAAKKATPAKRTTTRKATAK